MSGSIDRVMAVTTIQLQLARMDLMAEWDGLYGPMPNIHRCWMDGDKKASPDITAACKKPSHDH